MGALSILRTNRNFALVWLGGLISLTGDWMLLVGLPLYAYQLTGSTLATGLMLAMRIIPRLLLGSVAGVFVDRWDRRRTLVTVNLILAAGLTPFLLAWSAEQLWIVYVAAFVQACFAQFVQPAEGALLPRLVPKSELLAANSLNSLNNNAARLIGPPLGGFAVSFGGLAGVALLDAASFLVAAFLIWLTRVDAGPQPTERPRTSDSAWVSVWKEWLAGLHMIRTTRPLAVAFAFMAITSVGEGVMGALFVPFVISVIGSDELGYGAVVSAQAVGGLIGSLALSWYHPAWRPARMVGFGAMGLCGIDLLTFNYHIVMPGLTPALVFMALVGFPIAAMMVGYSTLVQLASTDAYRGRVLGATNAVAALASLLGAGIAGALGERVGIVTMLNVQGFGYFLAGIMVMVVLAKETAPTTARVADAASASHASA